jgi:hypothetical protein
MMMLRIPLFLTALLFAALPVAHGDEWLAEHTTLSPEAALAKMPAPFHAEYRVKVLIARGKAVLTLDYADNGDYKFSTSLAATGIWKALARGGLSEVTVFDLEPSYPQTINYSLINEFGSRPRNGEYEFLWDEGVARGIYKDKPIELPIDSQVMDRSLLPIRMMHDLTSGRRPTSYTILDRDELVEIEMGYGEEKVIKVPYGKFTAMKIRHLHPKDDEESFIWVAPELGYLPVRLEQLRSGNKFMVADLVVYESLAPATEVAQR